jgi:hypothetical protein
VTAYSWTGVGGDWNDASDWTPAGGPPTPSDSAMIGGTGTYTVTVDSADVADSLTLSDANATALRATFSQRVLSWIVSVDRRQFPMMDN